MLYEIFVKRTTVEQLNRDRSAQCNAITANSTYLQSDEGVAERTKVLDEINKRFDDAIDMIMDPNRHEREMDAIRSDPMMAAGMRGLERLKWTIAAGGDPFAG